MKNASTAQSSRTADVDGGVLTTTQTRTSEDSRTVRTASTGSPAVSQTTTRTEVKTGNTSFLDNSSKVTGVQDILQRMRNADLGKLKIYLKFSYLCVLQPEKSQKSRFGHCYRSTQWQPLLHAAETQKTIKRISPTQFKSCKTQLGGRDAQALKNSGLVKLNCSTGLTYVPLKDGWNCIELAVFHGF